MQVITTGTATMLLTPATKTTRAEFREEARTVAVPLTHEQLERTGVSDGQNGYADASLHVTAGSHVTLVRAREAGKTSRSRIAAGAVSSTAGTLSAPDEIVPPRPATARPWRAWSTTRAAAH